MDDWATDSNGGCDCGGGYAVEVRRRQSLRLACAVSDACNAAGAAVDETADCGGDGGEGGTALLQLVEHE